MENSNLRRRRRELGYTLAQLADMVGVRDATIQRYESGEIRNIKRETLLKLSQALRCTPGYLMGWDESEYGPAKLHASSGITRIPVLGVIPAGIPIEAIEDILDYEEIPAAWTQGGSEFFALRLKGTSMSPEYRSGDVVIFKRQSTCDNNEDCAVLVNGNDATFKRVERLPDGIILKPLNPEFESKFYTNSQIESLPIRILGVFWELRRSRHR